MPNTVVVYNGDGVTRQFTVPFDYLNRTFVHVYLNNIEETQGTAWSFISPTVIERTVAPGAGETLTIRRVTSPNRIVDFKDASVLRSLDLNTSQLQALHIAEEAKDMIVDTIGTDNNGNLDARWRRVVNVSNPVENGDALNFGTYKADLNGVVVARDRAEVAATKAEASAVTANKIATSEAFIATGGTEARTLADRAADIINIKDFGAKGNAVTDDTAAWERWQAALENGGIGYIPAGKYRVNGIIRYFVQGCFGNGIDHVMDASVYRGDGTSGMRESAFANHMGTIGPLLQQYREYAGKESWGPMVDLSFESVCDGNFDWMQYGSGAYGIQVRGSAKGTGNSHPVCIRGFMQNKLNGDGDAVAIWGRCQKEDPADGLNNSDTCAMHSAVYNDSRGSGLVMASEHWAIVGEGNGGTEQTNGTPAGATVCQHVKAFSSTGMAHAGILISGGLSNYPYGMWNAIQISRGAFIRNGSMDGIPGTTALKCDSWFSDLGYPDIGWHVGYCPNHIKTVGAYPFNITGDSLRIKNNTDGGSASIVINKVSGTGTAGIILQVDGVAQSDIYVEKGNPNTFYRARQATSSHHLFFNTDASGTLSNALSIGTVAVNPGTDGTIASGWSNKRWSQVYAATSTIATSDERLKEDIRPIDESVFKAWGKVEFRQFLFKDAVAKKGSAARIHIGLIAQKVVAAFASEGLDAMRYGIVCYDKWDAQEAITERLKVVTREETHNEDGSVKEPEEFHYEERVLTPAKEAGDCYSIRYEEALALECAYQRWLGEQRDARIAALERMNGVA